MNAANVRIAGWGKYLPSRVMDNHELELLVDTSDEWIRKRTGIVERRIAANDETTCTMAVAAARPALEMAGVDPADLDLIVVATGTPDHPNFPATGSLVQRELGALRAGAFDIGAGCAAFGYGLVTGAQFVQSGALANVLVIGADVMSRIIDWRDRGTCVLFGDGAGAVVLRRTARPGGLLSFVLGSDGCGAPRLLVPAGGSSQPASHASVEERAHYLKMDGRDVFRFATQVIPGSMLQALEKAGLTASELALVIPHQANSRIIEHAREKLELPAERVFMNVDRYGNTSSASIPVALCEALEQGRIAEGDVVAMCAFGAGLAWAATIWQWN
ncbi:MAG: ketoacyl-ACP synthase III [Chloroflexi bacterium]|nr:ketoacyl-ACP synthase III [Chloroflexota bacterium]